MQIVTSKAHNRISRTAIAPRKDGYFYTYVTNRSAGKVHFDNMVIKRWAPQVRVTYDYYAYGLTWEDPRLPGSPESIHDHCYQDKEFQWAEFTTGHGLALHDFHARMYDGATGRWLVPDPAAQFANPYLAMGNNPVVGVDPDGRFVVSAMIVGAVIGATMGGIQAGIQGKSGGEFWKAVGVGALTGAISGALGAYPLFGTGVGFLQGFAAGMVNGAISGAITGGLSAALLGQDIGEGIMKGAITGGITGGVTGGIKGIKAVNELNKMEGCYDDWYYRKIDGALVYKTSASLDIPSVQQEGTMNCVAASVEAVDKSMGGGMTQHQIRAKFGEIPNGAGLPFEDVYDYYGSATGHEVVGADSYQDFITKEWRYGSFHDEIVGFQESLRSGERVVINMRTSTPDMGHVTVLKSASLKTVLRQNGSFRSNWSFSVMNPAQGTTTYPRYNDILNAYSIIFVKP